MADRTKRPLGPKAKGPARPSRPMPGNFVQFGFKRECLPHPADFYKNEGIKLLGSGGWRSALCPFHKDTKPSMRVFFETGAFRCMVCGAKGGDILAFYMVRHGVRFIEAAKALGAWEHVQ